MAAKDEAVKKNPKIDFFNFDLKNDRLRPVFSEIYLKNNGHWSAINP